MPLTVKCPTELASDWVTWAWPCSSCTLSLQFCMHVHDHWMSIVAHDLFVLMVWPDRVTGITFHANRCILAQSGAGFLSLPNQGRCNKSHVRPSILQSSDHHISRHHVMSYWSPSKEGITSHSVQHSYRYWSPVSMRLKRKVHLHRWTGIFCFWY